MKFECDMFEFHGAVRSMLDRPQLHHERERYGDRSCVRTGKLPVSKSCRAHRGNPHTPVSIAPRCSGCNAIIIGAPLKLLYTNRVRKLPIAAPASTSVG